jgi:hypothetical protein
MQESITRQAAKLLESRDYAAALMGCDKSGFKKYAKN